MPQRAEHPADEVRAQTGFHANDARRQLLERVFETQSPDLPPEGNLPVDAQPDKVKNLLADADADADDPSDRVFGSIFGFIAASPDYRLGLETSAVGEAAGPSH